MIEDPDLWRASFITGGFAMPEVPEAIEDEALSVSLFEIEDEATAEPTGWQIDLLLRDPPDTGELAAALAPALIAAGATLKAISLARVKPAEWARASELRLPPVAAGRFVIHGSHARALVPADAVPIEIDAGLAFGSGEHATTRSCLAAIDRLALRQRFRRVLDLGCGSGVLAIAAAKCWPARVLAVDNDPIAVHVAHNNAELNGVRARVKTLLADGYQHPLIRRRRPYELIIANILADPLIEFAPALRAHLAPGGRAVLAGLLDRQADSVVAAHRRYGLRLVDTAREGPWIALVLRLPVRASAGPVK
jgi:ribosomal protein L11 methyltransferase